MASRCCCLASRYCRIAGVADADICLYSLVRMRVLALDTRRAPEAWRCRRRAACVVETSARRCASRIARASGCRASILALAGRARLPLGGHRSSSRSRRARDRSPACASASRRCRGWRSCTGGGWSRCRRSTRSRTPAAATLTAGALVGAWMDAHRRDVFSALYRVDDRRRRCDSARLRRARRPAVGDPARDARALARARATAPASIRRRRRGAVSRNRCGWCRTRASCRRRRWPARSAAWRGRARAGEALRSGGRPAALRAPARCRDRETTKDCVRPAEPATDTTGR